jgi:hypothetical protein
MAFGADQAVLLDHLDEELRIATELTRNLFARIIATACMRIPVLSKAGRATHIDRLIEAGAWSDAALALIELELPAWKVRRLICESGEWLCSLSSQPFLPVAMDDCVDAVHEELPLAVLRAFVEARRREITARQFSPSVPQLRPARAHLICCDNFA